MRPTTVGIVAGALALGASMAASAVAADFTIIVPVELSNLPDEARPQISCSAMAGPGEIIGIGKVDLPDSSDYSGRVTVSFDVFEHVELLPSQAVGYECSVALHPDADHAGLSWERCEEVGRDPASEPLVCGARGAPVTGLVEGAF